MSRFSHVFAAAAASLAVAACGSADDTKPAPAGPSGAKPVWKNAPTGPVTVGQGQTLVLALDLAGSGPSSVTATVDAPPELGAVVSDGSDTLTLHPSYTVSGNVNVKLALFDEKGGASEVDLTVDVLPIRWLGTTEWAADGPEAREHGALVVDEAKRRVLLLGGSGYDPYLNPLSDVWSWSLDDGTWKQLTPAGDPLSGGGSRRVAQVPGESVAYMFGGYGEMGATHDELVRITFDGDVPSLKILPKTTPWPPARALHGFVYDAVHGRFVMFGGAGTAPYDDLWLLTIDGDVATWTEVEPQFAPSKRYGSFYGLDAANNRVLLFSGAQSFTSISPARDTWVLDMNADPPVWSLLMEGEEMGVPPGRRNGCAVFDTTGPRMFVFGGTADAMTSAPGLFVLDARPGHERWDELTLDGEPDLRSSGFGFFDPGTQTSVLGLGNTSSTAYRDWSMLGH